MIKVVTVFSMDCSSVESLLAPSADTTELLAELVHFDMKILSKSFNGMSFTMLYPRFCNVRFL